MKPLFKLDDKYHGVGEVRFAWQVKKAERRKKVQPKTIASHTSSLFYSQTLGAYLATCGKNGLVHIFDRHGTSIQEITLETVGQCIGLEWDSDGEMLAIMQAGCTVVSLYEVSTQRVTPLETGFKYPSFLKWAVSSPCLAIGTDKGNLLLYRKDNRKKIPIMGRHSKKIVSGAWSKDDQLFLGGEDNVLSTTSLNGESVESMSLNNIPLHIEFAYQKSDMSSREEAKMRGGGQDKTLSANLSGATIFIHNFNKGENPIELCFEDKLGEIVTYRWFGDGYIMIGFTQGFLVINRLGN
jgi:WD repeat-containing protein 19